MDIALNFRTGYHDRAKILVLEPRAVVRRYLSTWFLLDLVSTLPFDQMVSFSSPTATGDEQENDANAALKVVRGARLCTATFVVLSLARAPTLASV